LSTNKLFDKAASFLHKELSPSLIQQLRSMHIDEMDQHFGIGLTVRNILRRSDFQYDDLWLDDNWLHVLKEAIKPN